MGKLKWLIKDVSFSCRDPLNSPKASAFRQLFVLPVLIIILLLIIIILVILVVVRIIVIIVVIMIVIVVVIILVIEMLTRFGATEIWHLEGGR